MSTMPLAQLDTAAFLEALARLDIELRLEEGKLRINAPAGVITGEVKAELVRRKDFLLATCRAAPQLDGALLLRPRSTDGSEAPLTFAQERLWLLERFQPGNFAYNIPELFEITMPVEDELLQRAIDRVTARHEILRTQIVESEGSIHGRVVQQVLPQVHVPLEVTQLDGDRELQDEQMKATLRQESRRPFNLSQAPLIRFHLFRLGRERCLLLVNLHHIIADRWSMRILYRELLAVYVAYAHGREPDLLPLPLQFGDYAVWERTAAKSRMQQQVQYWQQQLADLPEPLQFPFARPSGKAPSHDGAVCTLSISPEETRAVRTLAKENGASLYMVLLAVYTAVLRRYTQVTDLCIGSPVSERSHRETEPLIGLFVNTLVMRCQVPEGATFVEVLRGVRETVLNAHAHRDLPFQRVLSELNLQQGTSAGSPPGNTPLFQTMLSFDSYVGGESVPGSKQLDLDPGFAKFDLTLQLREEFDRISGWLEFRTDLTDAAAMDRFAATFLRLMRGVLADPHQAIEAIDILLPDDRQRLLHDWNATALAFPADHTIHQMFEEQAAKVPDAIAIIDGTRRVTYRELNRRANAVAFALQARGARPETIVGVHLPRSSEMIAAMLGILKAGAAYLPLDRNYPPARLVAMVEDSGCQLILTADLEHEWPFAPAQAVALPGDDKATNTDTNAASGAHPHNLAYVIYTSGSTGRPKGVAIEHHSTVSFLTWGRETFGPDILRGTLAATSISFDLSVFEIFLPLVSGHTVIVADDVLQLPALPAADEVTLITTVPSAAAALLDARAIPHTVRTIHLAGEPLPPQLVDRLYSETGITTVNDLYGPTETTTYSTWITRRPGQPATIGRPLANTRLYILDDGLRLVPPGVTGELLIAGEGVARGYLHRPELTAERFVELPHLGEPGRAYRTGDLCRYNADGTLIYLGRADQQVKVRGFRIELGEIEAVLLQHPAVKDAVVLALPDDASGASLAAAIQLQPGASLEQAALIEHQATLLPAHMVTRRLVAVPSFPHTPNGKLDRRKLAEQLISAPVTEPAAEPPQDAMERELLHIWQEGFKREGIGLNDDFFQIGGHSLLALRLFSEIEERIGKRMMLSVLFQAPTIRQLAAFLRQDESTQGI